MKYLKLALSVAMILASILLIPVVAHAQIEWDPGSTDINNVQCSGNAANSPVCQDLDSQENPLFGPAGVLTSVARIFGLVTGVISTFMVIISGLRYINSHGDPAKTASAKNTLLFSSIGLAVSAMAGLIVGFIFSRIGN